MTSEFFPRALKGNQALLKIPLNSRRIIMIEGFGSNGGFKNLHNAYYLGLHQVFEQVFRVSGFCN